MLGKAEECRRSAAREMDSVIMAVKALWEEPVRDRSSWEKTARGQ